MECGVCLKTSPNLRQITDDEADGISVACKLRLCVPEIDWKDNYFICNPCLADLNHVHQFREKCLNSDSLRGRIPTPAVKFEITPVKIEKEHPPDDSKPQVKTKTKRTFKCDRCEVVFKHKNELMAHAAVEHPEEPVKPYSCQLCEKKFATNPKLVQHLKYHAGERTHVCSFCGKGYITKNDLNSHEKLHLNKRAYKCDFCPKSFNTHKDIRSHKLVVHTDPSLWNHVCPICSKRFPIKSNFDAHMRRHNNERPYACHLCDKKFIDNCVLQKHFLSHTNNRPYVCNICKKEYKDKRVMEIHKKRIHNEGDVKVPERVKKFLCHLCPNAYFEKNKLTRHMWTHTDEKPFLCKICQKRFVDKTYVKQHMTKVHNILDYNDW